MTENLLHYIWQYRLYTTAIPLKTIDGEPVLVIHPGILNVNAGPDFLEAKIKIGSTTWAGNIEIHTLSSDWDRHQHQKDENYDKLILHVVYMNDAAVKTLHGSGFPTLELHPYLMPELLEKYRHMMHNKATIPCAAHFRSVKKITIALQIQRMLAERLDEKVHGIMALLHQFQNNWQEVLYVQLARSFGLHINQHAFEMLALRTPLGVLAKHKSNPLQIEALLFGQAGFLNDYFDEAYPLLLQQEYNYLKKLHHLEGVSKVLWKFLRLRPANFPTIRIAQFAQLIIQSAHLFSKIKDAAILSEIEKLFAADVSPYWKTHYTFGEISAERDKHVGKAFIQTTIINAIVPTLFVYGRLQGNQDMCDRAIALLQKLPAEKNSILAKWLTLGFTSENAADTQAILQLYNKYCVEKKCLQCGIGYEILKTPQ
ncbi:MAG: DUF2851 family protein [Chitinophagaceae bacterium]|nr:DUF2851 family protein [Chitinophagaceae bacterium]